MCLHHGLGDGPHCLDACCKPLVMSVLTPRAMVAMAQWIHHLRSGEESMQALDWMEWIQNKHGVLPGFMTMAGTAALKLTRQWENESRLRLDITGRKLNTS